MNCLRKPNRPMPTGAKNEEGGPKASLWQPIDRAGASRLLNLAPLAKEFLLQRKTSRCRFVARPKSTKYSRSRPLSSAFQTHRQIARTAA